MTAAPIGIGAMVNRIPPYSPPAQDINLEKGVRCGRMKTELFLPQRRREHRVFSEEFELKNWKI
jgi:hypothetical protein